MDGRPPLPRWMALAAVVALGAAAALTTWSILTDRARFAPEAPRATPVEAAPTARDPR